MSISIKKRLRSGYTTGACAAAAAKAAALLLLSAEALKRDGGTAGQRDSKKLTHFPADALPRLQTDGVDIPFPDGSRVKFSIHNSKLVTLDSAFIAQASVIKDAGDDPDVTNGAEIVAEAKLVRKRDSGTAGKQKRTYALTNLPAYELFIKGGKGVGIVTKPGLSVPVGEPAINPVPRQMIIEAVNEAMESGKEGKYESAKEKNCPTVPLSRCPAIEITISVPDGEELAKKTLNNRLGIEGGISILGTTGIVKPVSTEAWTATITSSMDVAKAMGQKEIVLSAGRASEKAHMKELGLPEESYVLMGDYLEYSLQEAAKHGFRKIHLCAQWAKMVKIAMATPQTHVRFGAIDIRKAVAFLNSLRMSVPEHQDFNTAREIFDWITKNTSTGKGCSHMQKICNAAKKYAEHITGGIPVETHLVSYEGKLIACNE